MQPLFWTCKSTKNLALELAKMGHPVSDRTVSRLLHDMHFSLQSNQKILESRNLPERNSQFEYINKTVKEFQANGQPVISVDTKKKELIARLAAIPANFQPCVLAYKASLPGLAIICLKFSSCLFTTHFTNTLFECALMCICRGCFKASGNCCKVIISRRLTYVVVSKCNLCAFVGPCFKEPR
jgi:hypothetical protein